MFEQKTIGELVASLPLAAELFTSLGIDYCCGGNRRLQAVLTEKGLAEQTVEEQLRALLTHNQQDKTNLSFTEMTPAELSHYIVDHHHAYLYAALPEITRLMNAVMRAHGLQHPELFELGKLYGCLRADLEQHLIREELLLFPAVSNGHQEQIANLVSMEIITEHEAAGQMLVQLRRVSSDYEVPEDACQSYVTLYQHLQEMEQDLHQHIHLENNVLLKRYDKR